MSKDLNKARALEILKKQGAIRFDRVRVQYRQQRREVIRHIVTEKLHDKEMDKYIKSRSDKLVDPDDQKQFICNIHEDLEQLGLQSIIVMGVTIKQVEEWKKNRGKS